jgi:hypothetical protein
MRRRWCLGAFPSDGSHPRAGEALGVPIPISLPRPSAPAPIGGVTIDLTSICQMLDSTAGTASCSGTYENPSSAFGGATSLTISQMLSSAASQSNTGERLVWQQPGHPAACQGCLRRHQQPVGLRAAVVRRAALWRTDASAQIRSVMLPLKVCCTYRPVFSDP